MEMSGGAVKSSECLRVARTTLLVLICLHVRHSWCSAAQAALNSLTPCAVMGVTHAESPRGRYQLSVEEAGALCRRTGTHLATLQQLRDANARGFQVCRSGWVSDGVSAVPRVTPLPQCAHGLTGVVLDPIPAARLDAFCYNASENLVNSCDASLGTRAPPLATGTPISAGPGSTVTPRGPGSTAASPAHRSHTENSLRKNPRAAVTGARGPTASARMNSTTTAPAAGNVSGTTVGAASGTTVQAVGSSSVPGSGSSLATSLLNNLTATTLNSTHGGAQPPGAKAQQLSDEVIITIAVVGGVIALCLLATIIYAFIYGCSGKRKRADVSDGEGRGKPRKGAAAELLSPYIEFRSRESNGGSLESVPLHTQPGGVNGVNGAAGHAGL